MANRNEKEASRKRILSTCVRLFLEQGFKHTPPKQILTEANVSAGTFYNLYRTKAGVLTELTEFMFQNQFTIAGQIAQGETDPVKLYAVETAIQLTLAELNENLRQIYVEAYTLPENLEIIHRMTAEMLHRIFGGDYARIYGASMRRVFYAGTQVRALFAADTAHLLRAGGKTAGDYGADCEPRHPCHCKRSDAKAVCRA